MAWMSWGSGDGLSPDFLLLSANNTELAEKREGHEGVGTPHFQEAGDLLQLAQAGLQLGCYVVCRKPQVRSEFMGRIPGKVDAL